MSEAAATQSQQGTVCVDWDVVGEDDPATASLQMAVTLSRAATRGSADANDEDDGEIADVEEGIDGRDAAEEQVDFDREHSHELQFESTTTEWRIDQIIRRRRAKPSEVVVDEHDPDYETSVVEWMLLVQWEGGSLTWERRAWLVDRGYQAEVAAFEDGQRLLSTKQAVDLEIEMEKPKSGPKRKKKNDFFSRWHFGAPITQRAPYVDNPARFAEYVSEIHGVVASLREKEQVLWRRFHDTFRAVVGARPHLASILGAMRFPVSIPYQWARNPFAEAGPIPGCPTLVEKARDPNSQPLEDRLASWWKNDGLVMTQLCPIGEPETLVRFYERYCEQGGGTPIISLCHGTQKKFASRIAESGMRVPGEKGVRVVNGSAQGVGIYTTCAPGFASSYAYPADEGVIFICAGMCPSLPDINNSGSHVFVYYRSDYVVPILAARFKLYQEKLDPYTAHYSDYQITDKHREELRYPPPMIFESLEEMLDTPNELMPFGSADKAKATDAAPRYHNPSLQSSRR